MGAGAPYQVPCQAAHGACPGEAAPAAGPPGRQGGGVPTPWTRASAVSLWPCPSRIGLRGPLTVPDMAGPGRRGQWARTWAALAGLAQRRQPAGPLARARHADSRWALALGEVWGSGGVGKDPGTCSWVSQPLAGPSTAQNAKTTPGTLRHLTEPHVVTREWGPWGATSSRGWGCQGLWGETWLRVLCSLRGERLRTGAAGGFPLARSTQGHRTLCLAWHFPDPGRGSWTPGSLSWGWPGRGQWALSPGGWELQSQL